MKKGLIALVFVVFIAMFSCGDNPSEISPVLGDYYPMKLGDWWEYEYSVIETAPDSGLSYHGSEYREVISQSENIFEVECIWSIWLWNWQVQPDTVVMVDTLTVIVTPDSVSLASSDSTYIRRILDFPLEVGKTWDVFTVLDLDANVETPAQAFDSCANVQEYWDDNYTCYFHNYYCPDVGPVEHSAYDVQIDPIGNPDRIANIIYKLTGSSYL